MIPEYRQGVADAKVDEKTQFRRQAALFAMTGILVGLYQSEEDFTWSDVARWAWVMSDHLTALFECQEL